MSFSDTGARRVGSAGTSRGNARRQDLLARVVADLETNGLVDFSLRRAARAAGTTHKVLLYHFGSAEVLLAAAVHTLRAQRVERGLAAAVGPPRRRLSERVRAIWPVLTSGEARVLDQAIGLTMYDPARYSRLGTDATRQYLPGLVALCPPRWTDRRKHEVAELILATLRGLLIGRLTGAGEDDIAAGLDALARALDREERSPP